MRKGVPGCRANSGKAPGVSRGRAHKRDDPDLTGEDRRLTLDGREETKVQNEVQNDLR